MIDLLLAFSLCSVTSVTDGDSFRVSCLDQPIRLACLDAPELDQPYGLEAKQTLEALLKDKDIEIVGRGDAGFNRLAAIVYV